jgi:CubicO group peptidase (beta-lactamase class C family)
MAIDRVRGAAARHVGNATVPGLVALVARGDDVQVEAHGRLGVGRAAVQRDSLFRIASITKPITAAVTMVLVDEGLIGLDEPVDRLLPELSGRRVLKRPDGPPNPDVQPDADTWIAGLGSLPLIAQPGERWLYNTGASVLGVLVRPPTTCLRSRGCCSRAARACCRRMPCARWPQTS